jgi:hypothetical protein
MHGPRQHHVVTSPARCPLEPEDLSLKNFDLASSEGIIAYGAPTSHLSHRWIEAKRSDEHLLAQLADLPRDRDGKVAVRRAAAALGTGPDRARRLLAQAGLRRVSDEDDPTNAAAASQSPVPVPRTDHHQAG